MEKDKEELPRMEKNKYGENVSVNAFGLKTYLPSTEDLEELGFDTDPLFRQDIVFMSNTGGLKFSIYNSGTSWTASMCVSNGMVSKNEITWAIHPQSKEDVLAIIRSFTGQFKNRNQGIH